MLPYPGARSHPYRIHIPFPHKTRLFPILRCLKRIRHIDVRRIQTPPLGRGAPIYNHVIRWKPVGQAGRAAGAVELVLEGVVGGEKDQTCDIKSVM